ncbi:MAG: peroxiredoxin [Bacteroidales bacterium]|nr:peroxiredoxin [Bacteroidales bacterium]
MKKTYIIILALSIVFAASGQIPMLGDRAPEFEAKSTKGDIKFPKDYYGKWKILFSHPGDFTPVCTTEILELADLQDEFKELNTQLIVLSTDGLNSHLDWIKSMEEISYKNREKADIDFPFISDVGLDISKKYGMIHPNNNSTKNVRAVFIIDPEDKISSITYYPDNIGRNIDEILRNLEALQEVYANNKLTPANWVKGESLLVQSPDSKEEAEKLNAKKNLYSLTWYLWFEK